MYKIYYHTGGNNIVKIIINEEKCTGCGECVQVCRSRSLTIRNNVCYPSRPDDCKLCMLCKAVCPQKAIEIEV
ncbi:MAG: 4Fe-4S binding protein [Methanosarcinales archaeon]|nr:4Fe-4S binding protein [Methanosarcinales archaeon]